MSEAWSAVDAYLAGKLLGDDPVLDAALAANAAGGLPAIDVSPVQGKLLHLLARVMGARRILEIGTCIGYSGIWLARALPQDGMLITMEKDQDRAAIAKANFERAGVSDKVSIMIGDAGLKIVKVAGPFDVIFQDGHKPLYNTLLDPLVRLLRPGGLLITDNVLWDGEVVPGFTKKPQRNDEDTRAIAEYNERITTHPQLLTSIVPLRDGVAISIRTH